MACCGDPPGRGEARTSPMATVDPHLGRQSGLGASVRPAGRQNLQRNLLGVEPGRFIPIGKILSVEPIDRNVATGAARRIRTPTPSLRMTCRPASYCGLEDGACDGVGLIVPLCRRVCAVLAISLSGVARRRRGGRGVGPGLLAGARMAARGRRTTSAAAARATRSIGKECCDGGTIGREGRVATAAAADIGRATAEAFGAGALRSSPPISISRARPDLTARIASSTCVRPRRSPRWRLRLERSTFCSTRRVRPSWNGAGLSRKMVFSSTST